LGPVFNDTSCAACHNQGGLGGAGTAGHNVQIVTISAATNDTKKGLLHPGFKTQGSVVLHQASVERRYEGWRERLLNRASRAQTSDDAEEIPHELRVAMQNYQQGIERGAKALAAITGTPNPFGNEQPARGRGGAARGGAAGGGAAGGGMMGAGWAASIGSLADRQPPGTLTVSERNSIALFGAGLIDRIPDAAIEAAAAQQKAQTPATAGRVARLPSQRIGRFGWHAQQASLADFALTACAVELGLNVPEHPQAGNPLKPNYQPPGMDMTADECVALVAYLAALPQPQEPQAGKPQIEDGRRLFERIGCADCHRANLGDVSGLYSDLLMHDMGSRLQGSGYGAFAPDAAAAQPAQPPQPAQQSWHNEFEWRTPPLWGVAASAPYLHDGHAASLREAIVLHGGQAEASAEKFRDLAPPDQQRVLQFLGSLVAPASVEQVAEGDLHPGPVRAKKPARAAAKRARRMANHARE
jgi:mono/diheme cytochrome c family protein